MNKKDKFDVIVVGSGAGGAAVAWELTKRGKRVLILEAGPDINQKYLNNFWRIAFYPGYYKNTGTFSVSREGMTIYHTKNTGGTTVFACGNMVRSLQPEFKKLGIDLEKCFKEAEQDVGLALLDDKKIVLGSRMIMETAQRLGYKFGPMPKGGSYKGKCNTCHDCVLGCATGAKWDARRYISVAIKQGATLVNSTKISKVLFTGLQVRGVKTSSGREYECGLVILSAGGLNTPVILQKSGADAGHGLFIDPYWTVLGIHEGSTQLKGASMSAVDTEFHDKGFILAPFIDHWSQIFYFSPWWHSIHSFEMKRVTSIMIKISDERSGRVHKNGSISKTITDADLFKLEAGAKVSNEILRAAGTKDIVVTRRARGAHPGGTAAIGEVVNSDLQVKGTNGLYVCDTSVFPESPGLPPILTIVALAKWLGKRL